jgi:hypothetical protein
VPPKPCPKQETRKPCSEQQKSKCVKRQQVRKPCKKRQQEQSCTKRTTCVNGDGTESTVREDGSMALDPTDMGSPEEAPSGPPPVSAEATIDCKTCNKVNKNKEEKKKKSCGPCGGR